MDRPKKIQQAEPMEGDQWWRMTNQRRITQAEARRVQEVDFKQLLVLDEKIKDSQRIQGELLAKINNLKIFDFPKCPVCCEEYESSGEHQPRVMMCGHTICRKCIVQQARMSRRSNRTPCPVCFQTALPSVLIETAVATHTNYQLREILSENAVNQLLINSIRNLETVGEPYRSRVQPEKRVVTVAEMEAKLIKYSEDQEKLSAIINGYIKIEPPKCPLCSVAYARNYANQAKLLHCGHSICHTCSGMKKESDMPRDCEIKTCLRRLPRTVRREDPINYDLMIVVRKLNNFYRRQ